MAYSDSQLESGAERLFVLSGELRGVSVPLGKGTFRVGSSNDCDVILLSKSETDSEASFTPSDDGKLFATDPVGDVRIGRKTLAAGKRLVVKPGTPVKVGDTKLMLAESIDGADRSEKLLSRRYTQFVCAISIMAFVSFVGVYELLSGRNTVLATPIYPTVQGATYLGPSDFVSAAEETQKQLDSVKLSHILASADDDVGTVKVRGRLRESEIADWKTVSSWFDTVYGGSIMMDAEFVSVSDAITLPFSISAVWTGRESRLTLHDGSQRHLGELLPGGWKLEKITPKQITISKSGESLMVPL